MTRKPIVLGTAAFAAFTAAATCAAKADLDLAAMMQPLPKTAVMREEGYFVWGGSMVKGEDGLYHLFYARWPKKTYFAGWVTHSEIAHATAPSPAGPWTRKDDALPKRGAEFWDGMSVFNPCIRKFDGTYYLYYTGNTGDGKAMRGLNWNQRNNQRIGVAVAKSPFGPWRRFDKPIINTSAKTSAPDSLVTTNPAITQRPDGTYELVYKAVGQKKKLPAGGPVVHLSATSKSPTGPFKKDLKPIFTDGKATFPAEDPCLFTFDGKTYAAIKDQNGYFVRQKGRSLVLFEKDENGEWKPAPHAFITGTSIRHESGETQNLKYLERPQVYMEDGKPVALLCAAGTTDMKDTFNVQIPLAPPPATAKTDGGERFPFIVSYGGADNATSVAHLLDAPAGKHGFVRANGSEFATDAGPIRFNGTNLTGPANFPERDVADRLASRFARFGINCVRLHFMDTWYKNFMDTRRQCILDDDAKTQRRLSPAQLDKLDYLVAAFKKRGIYVNMNLHVGRTLDKRDGVPAGSPWANKTVGQFHPRCIELQKEYARDLLTHVNKYTGNAYTDEPAVAMIEISNEDRGLVVKRRHNSIKTLAKPYQDELEKQWNGWLKKKYPNNESGYANGKALLLNRFPKASAQFRKDFDDFIWDAELTYWKGMRDYIRNTLKAKQPVSGTQAASYSPREIQAQLDYVDAHAYFHHPKGKGRGWVVKSVTNEWVAGGESIVHDLLSLAYLESRCHAPAKPFTVSEYSHPFPSPFTGEGQPLACAYGRAAGWDGVFQYSYNHYPDAFEPDAMPWCIFDAIATPSVWVHFPACAAMMVRGDLREDRDRKLGEFIWNRDRPGKEYVAVNTKNSKLFAGYADGREIPLGDVSLKVGATGTGAAVVSLVSRNATGFGADGKASLLVAASGVAANAGAKIERVSEKLVRLLGRGHAPVCAEGIPCDISLPASPARVKCWALAGDGSRMKEIAPEAASGGSRSRIRLSTSCRTLWYEIAVR